ncbi:hypothetical protein [Desulfosarcina ovata]|uniref:Uncharacterized protein n=1 Tax=Desulfosarcina ovata subsp. ovata TaxID=2752305 RepID=A0A5K8AIZ3_9BACT|nr:hypothetical protein [Desulfosarcina ovata]BBO92631.1 hypothetical protein DSCOOX_58110 [Desulfosarcina ovata subsp. ovata]
MNLLFILCEGPHDAQFIGRLLDASNQYEAYKQKISDYPPPLNQFLSNKFKNHDIDTIVIGRPKHPMIPVLAYRKAQDDILILPYPIGGIDKSAEGIGLLEEFSEILSPETLSVIDSDIEKYAVLFVFDADSRGINGTLAKFSDDYRPVLGEMEELAGETWFASNGISFSVFIFTGKDGDTGTLEDNLINLFQQKNADLVENTFAMLDAYSDHETATIEKMAKRYKSALTVCGQTERKNAGSALTVIIRDTKLLDNAIDIDNDASQWGRMLRLIDSAFDK